MDHLDGAAIFIKRFKDAGDWFFVKNAKVWRFGFFKGAFYLDLALL
jgi:hypothetical protein